MNEKIVAPYGSWKSPVTTDLITGKVSSLDQVEVEGEYVYWVEGRPWERGRQTVMRCGRDGRAEDVTPSSFNVRTRVHEYGGGAFAVSGDTVYFANYDDQRLYRYTGGETQAITPESGSTLRYADIEVDALRGRLLCVREDHRTEGTEAENALVALDLFSNPDGGTVIASGYDFYSDPRLSPDGKRLAWLAWNHPNMPWDATELWLADLDESGGFADIRRVAGGFDESIVQPRWSRDGALHFISDRTGWWNLYRVTPDGPELLYKMEADFGAPQWRFRGSTYDFLDASTIICRYMHRGSSVLARLNVVVRTLEPLAAPYTSVSYLTAHEGNVYFIGAGPTESAAIVRLDPSAGQAQVLHRSSDFEIDPGYISVAEAITFPTTGGKEAYGFYYAPANRDYAAPEGERPPLLVLSHGGPTSATSNALSLNIQYWTSRGFAVLDVNYGGSTGYGRAYRQRLNGQWGIVDVDDCVNGASYLAGRGLVDGERLAIRGGSAGGYTTLNALTFTDVFKAGASYYGISDLEAMAQDTHKFESRYLDTMVGPYPQAKDVYRERSSIHFTDRLSTPLILFQGLEDLVVPPNQSEMMRDALRAKGLPVAYLAFEGEQHGFRKAETIKRTLEAELYFYSRIFGFPLAEPIEPVEIENLPAN
jgi:dipeptidyl aminopeptidase/acylaminoacyl peptidase